MLAKRSSVLKERRIILWLLACCCLFSAVGFAISHAKLSTITWREAHSPLLVWSMKTKQKIVALTFDDGPDPRYTAKVLDILHKYQVKATFFLVGKEALAYPDLVARESKAGHQLGNHTFDHTYLRRENQSKVSTEIIQADKILHNFPGYQFAYFRPPKGQLSLDIVLSAAKLRKTIILWSISVEHHEVKTPEAMARRIINHIEPGMIILAHDGIVNRSKTVQALPMIIKSLQKKGYRFVTISELLAVKN